MNNSHQDIEVIRQFNEFQSQLRARIEATLKLITVISGGMLALAVGAIIGKSPSPIPLELLPELKWAWFLLFYSIAMSLLLMGLMVFATSHMSRKLEKSLSGEGIQSVATYPWLRILNVLIFISILISCISGIFFLSYVAIGVVHSS